MGNTCCSSLPNHADNGVRPMSPHTIAFMRRPSTLNTLEDDIAQMAAVTAAQKKAQEMYGTSSNKDGTTDDGTSGPSGPAEDDGKVAQAGANLPCRSNSISSVTRALPRHNTHSSMTRPGTANHLRDALGDHQPVSVVSGTHSATASARTSPRTSNGRTLMSEREKLHQGNHTATNVMTPTIDTQLANATADLHTNANTTPIDESAADNSSPPSTEDAKTTSDKNTLSAGGVHHHSAASKKKKQARKSVLAVPDASGQQQPIRSSSNKKESSSNGSHSAASSAKKKQTAPSNTTNSTNHTSTATTSSTNTTSTKKSSSSSTTTTIIAPKPTSTAAQAAADKMAKMVLDDEDEDDRTARSLRNFEAEHVLAEQAAILTSLHTLDAPSLVISHHSPTHTPGAHFGPSFASMSLNHSRSGHSAFTQTHPPYFYPSPSPMSGLSQAHTPHAGTPGLATPRGGTSGQSTPRGHLTVSTAFANAPFLDNPTEMAMTPGGQRTAMALLLSGNHSARTSPRSSAHNSPRYGPTSAYVTGRSLFGGGPRLNLFAQTVPNSPRHSRSSSPVRMISAKESLACGQVVTTTCSTSSNHLAVVPSVTSPTHLQPSQSGSFRIPTRLHARPGFSTMSIPVSMGGNGGSQSVQTSPKHHRPGSGHFGSGPGYSSQASSPTRSTRAIEAELFGPRNITPIAAGHLQPSGSQSATNSARGKTTSAAYLRFQARVKGLNSSLAVSTNSNANANPNTSNLSTTLPPIVNATTTTATTQAWLDGNNETKG